MSGYKSTSRPRDTHPQSVPVYLYNGNLAPKCCLHAMDKLVSFPTSKSRSYKVRKIVIVQDVFLYFLKIGSHLCRKVSYTSFHLAVTSRTVQENVLTLSFTPV